MAELITGNPRYVKAYRELIDKHGYAKNTILQRQTWPLSMVNHSDDELAFVAYYPLVWLERDPNLREIYLKSIERTFQIVRPETSPFYDFTYAAALQAGKWAEPAKRPPAMLVDPAQYDQEACMQWFRRVPSDLISWTVVNSKRRDLGKLHINRHGRQDSSRVLPVDERAQLRWNSDPYQLDEGDGGRIRGDGVFILMPYWMGRYHRFVE